MALAVLVYKELEQFNDGKSYLKYNPFHVSYQYTHVEATSVYLAVSHSE